jgi:hypothetical protein
MDLSTESALATITSSGRVSNFTASSPEEGEGGERRRGERERESGGNSIESFPQQSP